MSQIYNSVLKAKKIADLVFQMFLESVVLSHLKSCSRVLSVETE